MAGSGRHNHFDHIPNGVNCSQQLSENEPTTECLYEDIEVKEDSDFSEMASTFSSDLDAGLLYFSSDSEGSYEPECDEFGSILPHPQCHFPPHEPGKNTFNEEEEFGEEEQHLLSVNKNLWVSVCKEERKDVKSTFNVMYLGPQEYPINHEPIEYFNLFVSDSLINIIVRETNSYAKLCSETNYITGKLRPASRLRRWHNVTSDEIRKFLAITLNMGLTQRKNMADYWSQDPLELLPWYGQTMSYNRFQAIHAMLNLTSKRSVPKGQPGHDPWVKIRPFLDAANKAFKRYYVPGQNLRVDECVLRMKNNCSFIQYMPNKHRARFRIKRFDLVDSKTNYVVRTELFSREEYSGNQPSRFTQKFVLDLVKKSGCLGKGYHIFTDSYYITVQIAQVLLNNNTFLTGTISKHSKDLPGTIAQTQLGVQQSIYARNGSVLLVGYKEKQSRKPIYYISTAYHAEDYVVRNRSGCVVHKPYLVDEYNKIKGEGDCTNTSAYNVSCTRTAKCSWRMMFFNLLDICVLNAYILYAHKCQPDTPLSRKDFILSLCRSLAPFPSAPTIAPAPTISCPNGDIIPSSLHYLSRLPGCKLRVCAVCMRKGRTRSWCPGCNCGVHKECYYKLKHFPRPTRMKRKRQESSSDSN